MREIEFELEKETLEKLDFLLKKLGKTREEFINEAIKSFVDNYSLESDIKHM